MLLATDADITARQLARLGVIATVAAMLYGVAMGSYGIITGGESVQMLYGALKVPILLLVTFALTLPSFLVINTLLGLRGDLRQVLGALLLTQTIVAVALVSLAPLTVFWYVSFRDYNNAILFNAAMFALASLTAQQPLRTRYRELIKRDRRHATMLKLWIVVYAFVGIQMGWVLRPFIGKPGAPAQFFRDEKWDNAYVIVGRMIWDAIAR
jgi:hypothetical protein